jgi:hypothetical protein
MNSATLIGLAAPSLEAAESAAGVALASALTSPVAAASAEVSPASGSIASCALAEVEITGNTSALRTNKKAVRIIESSFFR